MLAAFFVRNGARLLDRRSPGWERKIDRGSLRISSSLSCILGQLYGHYVRGLNELGTRPFQGFFYGFMEFLPFSTYGQLNRAWQTQIDKRLATSDSTQRRHILAA